MNVAGTSKAEKAPAAKSRKAEKAPAAKSRKAEKAPAAKSRKVGGAPAAKRREAVGGEALQLSLAKTGGWGGKRKNAGRKPVDGRRSNVGHARRPVHKGRHPVHVTLRAKYGLPSFRQQRVHKLITEVLRDQRRRRYKADFRVLHFSIQKEHLHLIVEADTERALGAEERKDRYNPLRSGVSGLEIAFARRLNMMLRRKGKVWDDRYHRHDLKTPRETWNGYAYLFTNYTHHGERSYGAGVLDLHSSAVLFDGFQRPHMTVHESELWRWPICRAETWLASRGYLKHGRLTIAPTN